MANANPEQLEEVIIEERFNSRGKKEFFIKGKHASLQELKRLMLQLNPQERMMDYLELEMPPYPTPVEFCVSDVAHVTVDSGFEGIMESEEFRPGAGEFLWWDLKIKKEEIRAAEERYIELNELSVQQPFLEKFTTSPGFKSDGSRYGTYRFTFPLTDLMKWYKEQHCGGEDLVLRVFETVTYRQEIMYTVLIHSPDDNQRFSEYPLLEASEWVKHQDGRIIWKAQAICGTHDYQFVSGRVEEANARLKYYVWDHVCLVFHLPNSKVLKIPREDLIRAVDACKVDYPDLSGYEGPLKKEERFLKADRKVRELKGLEEE